MRAARFSALRLARALEACLPIRYLERRHLCLHIAYIIEPQENGSGLRWRKLHLHAPRLSLRPYFTCGFISWYCKVRACGREREVTEVRQNSAAITGSAADAGMQRAVLAAIQHLEAGQLAPVKALVTRQLIKTAGLRRAKRSGMCS